MKRIALMGLLVVLCCGARARSLAKAPPLMPSAARSSENTVRSSKNDSQSYDFLPGLALGLEVSTLGLGNSSNPDFLGLRFLYGGRFFMHTPINRRVILKPTLGYFRRMGGTVDTGILEHVFEGGLGVHYLINPQHRVQGLLGLMSRLEVRSGELYTVDRSDTSPVVIHGRIGPMLGLQIWVDKQFSVNTEIETGFSTFQPSNPFLGTSVGFSYVLE